MIRDSAPVARQGATWTGINPLRRWTVLGSSEGFLLAASRGTSCLPPDAVSNSPSPLEHNARSIPITLSIPKPTTRQARIRKLETSLHGCGEEADEVGSVPIALEGAPHLLPHYPRPQGLHC